MSTPPRKKRGHADSGQKPCPSIMQKDEQKRTSSDRSEHCIIIPSGDMKLIDSPFIQKSKRRRYELPYKYPPYSEYQSRPRPPKPNPVKRPPPPRPFIRTYPTYKERIQMMERGLYYKQAPPHIGVFKRSEDNPDLLIVDETGQTTVNFPNIDKQSVFASSYSFGPHVSGLNGNNCFHPRIIGTGPHYAEFKIASSSVNLIPQMYPQQLQRFQYPYLTNVHGSYYQAPGQMYQQAVPCPASRSLYSKMNCSPVTSGSITVRYEPLLPESFENIEILDDEYLEHDPFLNIDLNDSDLQIDGDEVEFDMMGLDSEQNVKEEEMCDDLDDINPTIAPFEGIDQYLSLDGQPYVMIPVDMDVAKKLGWPIHMLPTMPKWLSKMIDNEVTSTDDSSTELLMDIPKVDSSTTQAQDNDILDVLNSGKEPEVTVDTDMPELERQEKTETMNCFDVNSDLEISLDGTDTKDEKDNNVNLRESKNVALRVEDQMPTATGERIECCDDNRTHLMSPDERGDQGRPIFTSTPIQSPLQTESNSTEGESSAKMSQENFPQSSTCSPVKPACQGDHHRGGRNYEVHHFKEFIRQETIFSKSSEKLSTSCNSARKPSVILESLLDNSDTEMDETNGVTKHASRERNGDSYMVLATTSDENQ